MKKYASLLLVACALQLTLNPVSYAQTLSEKVEVARQMSLKININTASAEDFQRLPGIGAKKAADIIAYRTQNGDFASVQQLTEVKGIGDRLIAKFEQQLTVKEN